MDALQGLVGGADPELSLHLETQGLKPILYAMRWVTLMLSQEFALPDVLRLWDSILAQEEARRMEFLLHLCCGMVLRLREELLAGDFADNLTLLQSYPRNLDVEELVFLAKHLQSVALCDERRASA